MVRFKVIRGSHLMLALSASILIAVLLFILLQSTSTAPNESKYISGNTQPQQMQEAKVFEAFASDSVTNHPLQIEIKLDKQDTPPLQDSPRILVYHTHTHEAYKQTDSDPYEAIESWRTLDTSYSVVRVGAALVDELSKRGYFAVHDTTDHELNDIDQAYVRSLETLESYSGEFDLVIDLHRDAYADGMQMHLESDGNAYAQMLLLVGDGGQYTGEESPDYERNLSFAQRLTTEMNRLSNGIARNVTIKRGRFNQHIGNIAVLIEVGHNYNTLDEALRSIPILAQSIAQILK